MGTVGKHRRGSVVTLGEVDDYVDVLGFGGAGSDQPYPELSAEEQEREQSDRRSALERKRPCGFAAAWKD